MKTLLWVKARHTLLGMSLFFTCLLGLASTSVTRLSDAPSHNLSQQAQLLRDASGALTITDVAALPISRLSPLNSELSLGFTSDVVWIKVTMSRVSESDPEDWYLVLGQTVLKDARLYKPLPDGGFTEHYGTQIKNQPAREVNHRRPIFTIHQHELGEKSYWIRIETPTAMNTSLTAIQREVFAAETTLESFFWGLIFGGYIITIVFYTAYWIWTREPIQKNYIAYITINFLAAFFTSGWPSQIETLISSETAIKFLGIWISLSIITGTKFSIEFIDLTNKNPTICKYLLPLNYLLSLSGIILITNGYYRWTAPLLQAYSMFLISLFLILSIYHSIKGDSKAKFYFFAFGLFYLGVFFRYLRNISAIDPNFWNENIYQITAFVHMLVMSIGIFANYNKLRKEKQIAESRANAESRLREEQGEFLSLVSHELRTPLTISSASVDNLLQQSNLSPETEKRVNKIFRSNERMNYLINNYLSKERLLMDISNLNIEEINIKKLCHLAASDMYDSDKEDIQIDILDSTQIKCDAAIIRMALNNILQNSMRYSRAPGSIRISTHSEAKIISIKIADKGPGIPDNELDLIFTRHFRGKNSANQPGAGFGLYLVNKIMIKHGGNVSVRNLPDSGCELSLNFPR